MILSDKDSFVIFSYPYSQDVFIIKGRWRRIKDEIDLHDKAFVMSDFSGKDIQSIEGKKQLLKTNISIFSNIEFEEKILDQNAYSKLASLYINNCKLSELDKIILSRIIKQSHDINDLFPLFKHMNNNHEYAFSYLLSNPKYGMWMGASPETLIKGSEKKKFTTIALAGSQQWSENIIWKNKELEEQNFVATYIEGILNKFSNNVEVSTKLETLKAGKIAHIKSEFTFTLNSSVLELIKKLHPTPAVCGIPKDNALKIIKRTELHKRQLYCGYIGEISNNDAELYVNLRCMKISKSNFYIFVGGGITSKSKVEKEWEETQLKAQTMLELLS